MSIIDKITGRTKKAAGDLTDDASLRREGAARSARARRRTSSTARRRRLSDKADEVVEPRAQDLATQFAVTPFAGTPLRSGSQEGSGEQQQDADHARERDRRLVEAEEARAGRSPPTVVSWPATVAAVTPPAPSVRTVSSTVVT